MAQGKIHLVPRVFSVREQYLIILNIILTILSQLHLIIC